MHWHSRDADIPIDAPPVFCQHESTTSGVSAVMEGKRISTACQQCRRRKTKCTGTLPVCITCQTQGTKCVYDFDADARKTPSKAFIASLTTRIKLLEGLLDEVADATSPVEMNNVIRRIREQRGTKSKRSPAEAVHGQSAEGHPELEEPQVLREMTNTLAHLHVDDETGTIYSAGATSNLVNTRLTPRTNNMIAWSPLPWSPQWGVDADIGPATESTCVNLTALEQHLLRLYFTWQHPFFLLFSRERFMRDLSLGGGPCFSPLLLYVILATSCHFSDLADEQLSDRYFATAKRLLDDEIENPSLTTCQALVLMGTREAGCGRERGSGWLYGGNCFLYARSDHRHGLPYGARFGRSSGSLPATCFRLFI